MSVINIWCGACQGIRTHAIDATQAACTGCGNVRHDLGEGLALAALTVAEMPVKDMRFCPWCRETKATDHDCPASAVGCTAGREDGSTCGECQPCTTAQSQWLDVRRAEFEHGSPSDLHHP
jgi:hypothetical protein